MVVLNHGCNSISDAVTVDSAVYVPSSNYVYMYAINIKDLLYYAKVVRPRETTAVPGSP